MSVELVALLVGLANGAIMLLKPIGRIHSRIDALEYHVQTISESLTRIEKRLEYEIERVEGQNP
jgi:hypothetical protein